MRHQERFARRRKVCYPNGVLDPISVMRRPSVIVIFSVLSAILILVAAKNPFSAPSTPSQSFQVQTEDTERRFH